MEFNRWSSPGYVINHLARLLYLALANEVKEYNVVPGQFPILLCLWQEDGLSQRQLCQRVQIEQATMSNTLGRMVRDGVVERRPDAVDGRSTRIFLTKRGRDLEMPLTTAAQKVNETALKNIPQQQGKETLDVLKVMITNLQASDSDGKGI